MQEMATNNARRRERCVKIISKLKSARSTWKDIHIFGTHWHSWIDSIMANKQQANEKFITLYTKLLPFLKTFFPKLKYVLNSRCDCQGVPLEFHFSSNEYDVEEGYKPSPMTEIAYRADSTSTVALQRIDQVNTRKFDIESPRKCRHKENRNGLIEKLNIAANDPNRTMILLHIQTLAPCDDWNN